MSPVLGRDFGNIETICWPRRKAERSLPEDAAESGRRITLRSPVDRIRVPVGTSLPLGVRIRIGARGRERGTHGREPVQFGFQDLLVLGALEPEVDASVDGKQQRRRAPEFERLVQQLRTPLAADREQGNPFHRFVEELLEVLADDVAGGESWPHAYTIVRS